MRWYNLRPNALKMNSTLSLQTRIVYNFWFNAEQRVARNERRILSGFYSDMIGFLVGRLILGSQYIDRILFTSDCFYMDFSCFESRKYRTSHTSPLYIQPYIAWPYNNTKAVTERREPELQGLNKRPHESEWDAVQ